MAINEYQPGTAFPGVIGRTIGESRPAWPQPLRARPARPTCCSSSSTTSGSGSSAATASPIATPNFDALAAGGLRYNNMHTTALCSPSRSCMLTGRNHHCNGMAASPSSPRLSGLRTAHPVRERLPLRDAAGHGYNTYTVGKWHLTPTEQADRRRPLDRWPLGRGFERFYGFLGGDTSQ